CMTPMLCTRQDELCVFFFQAEDGIRDRNVTGVQTCALPIWARDIAVAGCSAPGRVPEHPATAMSRALRHEQSSLRLREGLLARRSEERRVGKECRSR